MGKIINILGPHGAGKTTLQNYIKDNSFGIVAEGFMLPIQGFDLEKSEEYLEYEKKYIALINQQNTNIKNSNCDGYVIRSIEEVEYFLQTHIPAIDGEKIREMIDAKSNILCDLIVYLDAEEQVLKKRILDDDVRDQAETVDWYANDYEKYAAFWKNHVRTHIIDTTNLSISAVFEEIIKLLG